MFVIWIESGDSVRDEYTEILLETTEHTKIRLEMRTQRFCQRWAHRDSVRDRNTEILLEMEHTEIPLETEHTELSCLFFFFHKSSQTEQIATVGMWY